MKNGKTTLIISDIHTRYHVITDQVRHAGKLLDRPVHQVVVLGDFGFFEDEMRDFFRRSKNRFPCPVATIEGNHEDFEMLAILKDRFADVVTHLPRGHIHTLGRWRGLCLGGARYMDLAATPRGCEITDGDLDACLNHEPDEVDLVVTHDCPAGIGVPSTPGLDFYGEPGEPRMRRLAERYRPRWWFFGHHHQWFDEVLDDTRYLGLPQSWEGYILLHEDGQLEKVTHPVAIDTRPWWKRWLQMD